MLKKNKHKKMLIIEPKVPKIKVSNSNAMYVKSNYHKEVYHRKSIDTEVENLILPA
jgi:hypothetical protein